jgi:RNA polymerase sigma factor (sigma-70 family)
MIMNSASPVARPVSAGPPRGGADPVTSLFRAHGLALTRLALLLVDDQATAEDVVQDAFLGLYRALPTLKDDDKALGYLRVSVLNGCRSVHRARRRARLMRVQHEPPVWSAEAAVLAGEDRRAVLAALGTLTHRAREIMVLRYLLDLPQEEIAASLGITASTVSSTICRALRQLGRYLKEEQ